MALYIDALTDEQIARIEERMRPGKCSAGGFLGPHEKLLEVIHHDAATLRRLGVTHEQIATALDELVVACNRAGAHSGQTWVTVYGAEVSGWFTRGFQECPFEDELSHRYSSASYTVLTEAGRFSFPGMAVDLIHLHQFFEGRESPYRVDPETIVKSLQMR